MKKIKAYKVFNPDWTCLEFKYEIGKTYTIENPIRCERGFHACEKMEDCFSYYSFDSRNKVAEVELSGTILGEGEDKLCASQITIIREITWVDMLSLVNKGNYNIGKCNIGDHNVGHKNNGNYNTGYGNVGSYNTGSYNIGVRNSGYSNVGSENSGYNNKGDNNTGNENIGSRNTGCINIGYKNTGIGNNGWCNTGNNNIGKENTGCDNEGNSNTGYRNKGNCNVGDYNSGDGNVGYFNSITPDEILVFNKPCKWKDWDDAIKPKMMTVFTLTEWFTLGEMTDDEKDGHPNATINGGYLKVYTYEEAWKRAFERYSDSREIELLKALPNFDSKVFEEITGIKV